MATKKTATEQTQSNHMMSPSEARKFASELKNFSDKVSSSASASRKFLASAGITTAKGNLKKPYR